MAEPNFTLITELQTLTRRDFPLADSTLLQPAASNPLVDGEFLELNSSYLLARGTGESGWANQFPVYTERGRYDTQALGKSNVLMLGMYEAETKIYDSTGLAVGDALTVQDVTISSLTKRGLKKKAASSAVVVVGFVSRIVSGTGKIRFIHMSNQKVF